MGLGLGVRRHARPARSRARPRVRIRLGLGVRLRVRVGVSDLREVDSVGMVLYLDGRVQQLRHLLHVDGRLVGVITR